MACATLCSIKLFRLQRWLDRLRRFSPGPVHNQPLWHARPDVRSTGQARHRPNRGAADCLYSAPVINLARSR
jgi:hypothetical protein